MNGAERHGHMHEDLYGGRKGRMAMDPVMITTMSREIFHLQRSNAVATECDAASCYNRMIVGPTSIAETNAGTPEEVSTTIARTIEKMQYHMSTEKGVLDEFNCHSNNHPSHGTGQGTTDSPPK
eukprot:10087928-Ditylum_brightwellii.AAC.1